MEMLLFPPTAQRACHGACRPAGTEAGCWCAERNLPTNYVQGEICELEKAADGTKTAKLKSGGACEGYDEVLFAIGRSPVTASLHPFEKIFRTLSRRTGQIRLCSLPRWCGPD